jgi:UDP-N-acetylmuramoyl-L-alanyl-D-glutamate--2,6-diaminopimelate ligase
MTAPPVRSIDSASLLAALDDARVFGTLPPAIGDVAHDSRAVRPGTAFVALRGERADGHDFVARAVAAGARTIVVDEAYAAAHVAAPNVATIVVPDTRLALSRLAAAFYGRPSDAVCTIGVTGTNGKTTTTRLIAAILNEAGLPAGTIGTLGANFAQTEWPLAHTTPLAPELQRLLGEMRDLGARAVAMEVSSHALALDRVADVTFAVAVLTNVTRDHLDFHGTFEAYAEAKRGLFERAAAIVLNRDDPHGAAWATAYAQRGRAVTTYGIDGPATVRAAGIRARADGSCFTVDGRPFSIRLPGRFNVANALAALCVARALDIDDAVSARALAAFDRVPGRMEHFAGAGVDVLVDYAHTPDALDAVLSAARETAAGAVIVVFGCGGDRDRGKRPEMGRIASLLADRVFVTSDNPRGEEPGAIASAIVAGLLGSARVTLELDRHEAIRRAIAEAAPGDVVVVAGKGHESYQIVGDTVLPFDDRVEVRNALILRARASAR